MGKREEEEDDDNEDLHVRNPNQIVVDETETLRHHPSTKTLKKNLYMKDCTRRKGTYKPWHVDPNSGFTKTA